jgi:RNA polymerase sigma-70 factor (ECF subfamily)
MLHVGVDPKLGQAANGRPSRLIPAERREELATSGEQRQLPSDDCPSTRRLAPDLSRMDDRPGLRPARDAREFDPFDMTDDGASHSPAASHVSSMMEVMQAEIPPFERFYVEHRDEVLGYLRRLLGQRAEDAWQETFLRALRAYDRLQHARNLRSWVFTIATNVAMDELRVKPLPPVDDLPVTEIKRDAFRELEHLTGDLPPTERAAVVLRYGYDLPYAQIADALGSSEDAARAAASSGVRRLRRTHERHT